MKSLLPALAAPLFLLGACRLTGDDAAAIPLPTSRAPEGCVAGDRGTVPQLRLPRTEAPVGGAGPNMDLAQVHTINRPLEQVGVWAETDDGWSVLSLELSSPGARSMAVRLQNSELPRLTEIWLCSGDRRVRRGPYREATGGELWTPVVPGAAALLQVWTPTALKREFRAGLADAYGGYR